jgi:hypothetical protein
MWAKTVANQTCGSEGGWLVGSWTVGTAPKWIPRMHYFSREDRKFYVVRLNVVPAEMNLSVE